MTETQNADELIIAINTAAAKLEALEQQVVEARHQVADIDVQACLILGIDPQEDA